MHWLRLDGNLTKNVSLEYPDNKITMHLQKFCHHIVLLLLQLLLQSVRIYTSINLFLYWFYFLMFMPRRHEKKEENDSSKNQVSLSFWWSGAWWLVAWCTNILQCTMIFQLGAFPVCQQLAVLHQEKSHLKMLSTF